MKITKITQSKRTPEVYYIDLENGENLRVNIAMIADYSLFTGRDLSDDELIHLKGDSGKAASKARALRIMGTRTLSEKEISDKLLEKGEDPETVRDTVDWLKRNGFLNDEEYAAMIVRHYAAKGYGIGRVKNELYRRGIPKELWDGALEQMPQQDDTIDKYISSKLKGRDPDKKELKKVTDALYRRGFSWEEIKSALERYGNGIEEY